MTETTAPQTETTPVDAYRPCTCSRYVAAIETETADGQPDYTVEARTECAGTPTTRDFAPGHDAKLKSMLIKAGVRGLAVTDEQGSWASASVVAARFGFARQVEEGIARGIAKAEAKRAKDAAKAAKREARAAELGRKAQEKAQRKAEDKARKATYAGEHASEAAINAALNQAEVTRAELPQTSPVKIKVGRWEYTAEIDEAGTATFVDGKGETQTREEGTYRLLAG